MCHTRMLYLSLMRQTQAAIHTYMSSIISESDTHLCNATAAASARCAMACKQGGKVVILTSVLTASICSDG